MKSYLVQSSAALPPFQKSASAVRLHNATVRSRLLMQLVGIGCDVIEVGTIDRSVIAPGSLVLQDDLVVSTRLLRKFLSAIPDRRCNYQCEIDTTRFTFNWGSEANGVSAYRKLPLYYVGNDGNVQDEPLRLIPSTLYEFEQELPTRVDQITDMRAYIVDYYGVQLEHWFDLLIASSLYCREYVADLLRPLHRVLPHWLLTRTTSWSWFMQRQNRIGKRTRIHPTAILEGCVVGDDVVVGPFAYLRGSVIGDRAVIREKSSLTMAYVGEDAFVMSSGVVNSYIGPETSIFAPALYHSVFGERGLLGGAGGFADFLLGSRGIVANIAGKKVSSNLPLLGSAVGDDCFIGTNMIFAPGQTIPDGTKVFDSDLVRFLPTTHGGAYVVSGSKVIQVPDNFLGPAADD